jgi:hypothetical protein
LADEVVGLEPGPIPDNAKRERLAHYPDKRISRLLDDLVSVMLQKVVVQNPVPTALLHVRHDYQFLRRGMREVRRSIPRRLEAYQRSPR